MSMIGKGLQFMTSMMGTSQENFHGKYIHRNPSNVHNVVKLCIIWYKLNIREVAY